MSGAVHSVDNAEMLLKITGVISLFIQTMEASAIRAVTIRSS